jgi:hypothetical protein
MALDRIAPRDHLVQLRESLAEHYERPEYLKCESMGELIRENLESIRRRVGRPLTTATLPDQLI